MRIANSPAKFESQVIRDTAGKFDEKAHTAPEIVLPQAEQSHESNATADVRHDTLMEVGETRALEPAEPRLELRAEGGTLVPGAAQGHPDADWGDDQDRASVLAALHAKA